MSQRVFPAELDSLYEMLEFIKEFGQSLRISPSILDHVVLATEEALVNIISYGYPNQKGGTIQIVCKNSVPERGIAIVIKDQGIPFNPVENALDALPEPSSILDKSEHSLGGYGIYILVGLMDRVEYQRTAEGNILSLIKYL